MDYGFSLDALTLKPSGFFNGWRRRKKLRLNGLNEALYP